MERSVETSSPNPTGSPTATEPKKIDTDFRIIKDKISETDTNYYIMNKTGNVIVKFDESLNDYLSKINNDKFSNIDNKIHIQNLINNLLVSASNYIPPPGPAPSAENLHRGATPSSENTHGGSLDETFNIQTDQFLQSLFKKITK